MSTTTTREEKIRETAKAARLRFPEAALDVSVYYNHPVYGEEARITGDSGDTWGVSVRGTGFIHPMCYVYTRHSKEAAEEVASIWQEVFNS
jgi:hypothetical protein